MNDNIIMVHLYLKKCLLLFFFPLGVTDVWKYFMLSERKSSIYFADKLYFFNFTVIFIISKRNCFYIKYFAKVVTVAMNFY